MIEILQLSGLGLIQDGGRPGLRHLGIAQVGALDEPALVCANLLVGNPGYRAAIELSGAQLRLRFDCAQRFALTGAVQNAQLDNQPLYPGFSYQAQAGQQLYLPYPQYGWRAYLAVQGGFQLPECLGSLSTDLTAGFGGHQGRPLQPGDRLPTGQEVYRPRPNRLDSCGLPNLDFLRPLRVMPGPEWACFNESRQQLYLASWQISPQANRMGYRLQGPPLRLQTPLELSSEPTVPGLIQVPPNGQPILLLNDCQTLGGYPRIGCVISADLWRLAQYRPGSRLSFTGVSLEQADAARRQQQRYLQRLREQFHVDP